MKRHLAWIAVLFTSLPAMAAAPDGFRWTPDIGWESGPHRVDLDFTSRYRLESWSAFRSNWDTFHGFRTRLQASYAYEDVLRLVVQGQHSAVLGLGTDTSGVGALYRNNSRSGSSSSVDDFYLSQYFAELSPAKGIWLRGGRELVSRGTHVLPEDPGLAAVKRTRLSQRLLGTVGWTNVARGYLGGHALARLDGHAFHAYAFEPTTGVFEVERAYRRNRDILVAGLDYTLEAGTWRDDTELGAFVMGYWDDRDEDDVAGLFGDIEVYTVGAHWLGVYPLGAGRLDLLLWGAFQFGDYEDEGPAGRVRNRDQRAGAVIAEAGYTRDDLWGKPKLRLGVNYASGDDDPDDGTRHTFFNMLPTNHLYYGYLDQFAFQNLVDLLVQVELRPIGKLAVSLDYHRFWLAEDSDFRWSGTGAFSRSSLGFVRNASLGSHDAGHEIDLTLTLPVHRTTVLKGGYSHLFGGDAFGDDNADWLYFQIEFTY